MKIEEKLKLIGNEIFSNSQVTVILLRHSLHDEGVINKPGKVLIDKAIEKINRHFTAKGPIHFQISFSPTASENGQRRAENTGLILQKGLTELPNSRFIPNGKVMRNSLKGDDPSSTNILKSDQDKSIAIVKKIDGLTTRLLLLESYRPKWIKPANQSAFICVTHTEVLIPWLRSHGAVFAPSEEMPRADPIFVTLNMGQLKIDYPAKFP